jgi:hypothetical protein
LLPDWMMANMIGPCKKGKVYNRNTLLVKVLVVTG